MYVLASLKKCDGTLGVLACVGDRHPDARESSELFQLTWLYGLLCVRNEVENKPCGINMFVTCANCTTMPSNQQ